MLTLMLKMAGVLPTNVDTLINFEVEEGSYNPFRKIPGRHSKIQIASILNDF